MQYRPSECTATLWPVVLLFTRAVILTLAALLTAAPTALAQDPKYVNKLAPYVASPAKVVDRMLELANIRPGETVYDLGCGDGRILIEAAQRYKAKAVGIEISPKIAAEARLHIKKAGVAGQGARDRRRSASGRPDWSGCGDHLFGHFAQPGTPALGSREIPQAGRSRGLARLRRAGMEANPSGPGGRPPETPHLSLRNAAREAVRETQ